MCTSKTADCKKDGESALAVQAAQQDLTAKRREYYFALPGFLRDRVQPLLQSQDDLPIMLLFWNVSIISFPAAVAVFSIPAWCHVLGPLYLISSYILFLERYLLALHYSEHRKLFKKGQHAKQCLYVWHRVCKLSICCIKHCCCCCCCIQSTICSMALPQSSWLLCLECREGFTAFTIVSCTTS